MSCRYYGRAAAQIFTAIVNTGGNQCALILNAHAPCSMEMAGAEPDFNHCPLRDSEEANQLSTYTIETRSYPD